MQIKLGVIQMHVGEKVKVYFGFSGSTSRVLHEDSQGVYINYKNKRVPVRIDPHIHPNAKSYLALDLKTAKRKGIY